jgi:ABC-2 type transport system permease protein
MMLPLIIPVNIAAQSIVGEKTLRSLEPLLATPITTAELLIGKNLAAAIPAVVATWIGFGLFAVGAWVVVQNPVAFNALLSPTWLLGIFAVGPLLAVLSVNFSLMVSSRVNDARVAEQIASLVILPIVALFVGQMAGIVLINRTLILALAAVVSLLDIGLVHLTVRLFQRETILTRWK